MRNWIGLLLLTPSISFAGFPPMQVTAKANSSAQVLWVAQDVGNDTSGDGSPFRPYKTIGAGITAANAVAAYYRQVIVKVQPSTSSNGYNENVSLTQQGVNLLCQNPTSAAARACIVNGSLTINLTGTSGSTYFVAASNEVYISGMQFSPASGTTALVFSGSTYQRAFIYNSYFGGNNSAVVAQITNTGTNAGNVSGLRVWDTTFENNSSTNETMTLSAGTFYFYGTTSTVQNDNASGPSFAQTAASSMIANIVQFVGQYKLTDNTATASFNLCSITSGTNSCIVTPSSPNTGYALLSYFGCNSSNTNSITGTGVVVNSPANVRFGSSGDIVSTVTQATLGPGLPQGEILIGAGATTGTNVALSIKDGHIKVAQTTAPTTTLSGNAGTGGTPACTITNGTDSDGKISLKTGTASWATGTQCTINFNKTWGVAPICTFSPSNDAASTAMASQRIVMPDASTSAQTISAGVAFASQVTATFHYHCGESQ